MMKDHLPALVLLILALVPGWVTAPPELISPCPSVFTYRYLDVKNHIWYGTLFLTTNKNTLKITSIRILLDAPATLLRLHEHVCNSQLCIYAIYVLKDNIME